MADLTALDPGWERYPDTVLELFAPQGMLSVDLRAPIAPQEARRLAGLGPTTTFAIVTACNPHGRTITGEDNSRACEALRRRVSQADVVFMRADGRSPDGAHREEGVAVWCPRADAIALGVEFEQSAIFWFDGAAFWIVGAVVEAADVLLLRARAP